MRKQSKNGQRAVTRFRCYMEIASLTLSAWLMLAMVMLGQTSRSTTAGASDAAIEELRRIVQQQQQTISAQQKRLEELERKLDAVYPQQKSPAPADTTTAPQAAKKDDAPKDTARAGINLRVPVVNMTLYGFLRGDIEGDSSRMNIDPQLPFYVLSPADPSQGAKRAGDLTFHPRLTRFGFDLTAPKRANGWAAGAKLETDFFNAFTDRPAPANPSLPPGANNPFLSRDLVSNSRAALRIRHAYVRLQKDDWHVLLGQTWDVISPLFPSLNADTVMWNAGNTGDRRPQLRVGYEPSIGQSQWSFVGAVGAGGAVDNQDLDGDGFRDGEAAVTPTMQARLGYSGPSYVAGQTWSIGLYGHRARQKVTRFLAASRSVFGSYLYGTDVSLPLTRQLKLQGEFWKGRNLSDVRGGIGQGIDLATGKEVRASGGWAEASYRVTEYYLFNIGTTQDVPDAGDLTAANARIRNRTYYLTNRFSLGHGLSLGLDYGYWQTRYKRLPTGINNRFTFYIQQDF